MPEFHEINKSKSGILSREVSALERSFMWSTGSEGGLFGDLHVSARGAEMWPMRLALLDQANDHLVDQLMTPTSDA